MNCTFLYPGLKRCRKRARYHGKFAGPGYCQEHALNLAKQYGVNQFHAEYRQELSDLLTINDSKNIGGQSDDGKTGK